MDWHELEKMKVTDLREMAKDKAEMEGVSGMNKATLVEELAKTLGIDKPHKVIAAGLGKRAIKAQIREAKARVAASLEAKDAVQVRRARREIRRHKRKLRSMAKLTH